MNSVAEEQRQRDAKDTVFSLRGLTEAGGLARLRAAADAVLAGHQSSHRTCSRFQRQDFNKVSLTMLRDLANERMPDIDNHRGGYEYLSWSTRPGDCLVYHSRAVTALRAGFVHPQVCHLLGLVRRTGTFPSRVWIER